MIKWLKVEKIVNSVTNCQIPFAPLRRFIYCFSTLIPVTPPQKFELSCAYVSYDNCCWCLSSAWERVARVDVVFANIVSCFVLSAKKKLKSVRLIEIYRGWSPGERSMHSVC